MTGQATQWQTVYSSDSGLPLSMLSLTPVMLPYEVAPK